VQGLASDLGTFGYFTLSSDLRTIEDYTEVWAVDPGVKLYTENSFIAQGDNLLCIARNEADFGTPGLTQFSKVGTGGSWTKVGQLPWQEDFAVNTPRLLQVEGGNVGLSYGHRAYVSGLGNYKVNPTFGMHFAYGDFDTLLTTVEWSDVYRLTGNMSWLATEVGFGSLFKYGEGDASLHQIYCDNTYRGQTAGIDGKLEVYQTPIDIWNASEDAYDKDVLSIFPFDGAFGYGDKPLNIKELSGHGGHKWDGGLSWSSNGLTFDGSTAFIIDKLSGFKSSQVGLSVEVVFQNNTSADQALITTFPSTSGHASWGIFYDGANDEVYASVNSASNLVETLVLGSYAKSPTGFCHALMQIRKVGDRIFLEGSVNGNTFNGKELLEPRDAGYKNWRPVWLGGQPTTSGMGSTINATPKYLTGDVAYTRIQNKSLSLTTQQNNHAEVVDYLNVDRSLVIPDAPTLSSQPTVTAFTCDTDDGHINISALAGTDDITSAANLVFQVSASINPYLNGTWQSAVTWIADGYEVLFIGTVTLYAHAKDEAGNISTTPLSSTQTPTLRKSLEGRPSEGLVAWYPLTESAGDYGPNAFNGTAVNDPTFNADGVTTNGVDNYALLPTDMAIDVGTVTFKVKMNDPALGCLGGWHNAPGATGSYMSYIGIGSLTSALTDESSGMVRLTGASTGQGFGFDGGSEDEYADGNTHTITFTRAANGDIGTFADGVEFTTEEYGTVDGLLVSSVSTWLGTAVGARKIRFSGSTFENYYPVTVSEVLTYDRVLSLAEVQTL
jgi:hypothetical protein